MPSQWTAAHRRLVCARIFFPDIFFFTDVQVFFFVFVPVIIIITLLLLLLSCVPPIVAIILFTTRKISCRKVESDYIIIYISYVTHFIIIIIIIYIYHDNGVACFFAHNSIAIFLLYAFMMMVRDARTFGVIWRDNRFEAVLLDPSRRYPIWPHSNIVIIHHTARWLFVRILYYIALEFFAPEKFQTRE